MSLHYICLFASAYDRAMPSESERIRERPRKHGRNSSGEATRIKLITVAETMFADRGIAAVSLNEIRLAAGQSNAAVVNYHFGSKEDLIKAILEDRLRRIDEDRRRILDQALSGDQPVELRRILAALILPQVGSIERGERHVELVAQLLFHGYGEPGGPAWILADPSLTEHGQKLNQLIWKHLSHLPEAVATARLRVVYISCLNAVADHQRQRAKATDAPPTAMFVSDLIDSLTAIIRAPASAETLEALRT
ncbi:TetR family transcriptional regulator [Mycobacteroides abscessus]|nr:TetR family transcriptional regulator [Mycobacteroides abscessus]